MLLSLFFLAHAPTYAQQGKKPIPIADRDNDGINDAEDQCPDIAGPADRGGCPEHRNIHSTQYVAFAQGVCLSKNGRQTLQKVLQILKQQQALKATLHLDTENAKEQQHQKRVKFIQTYLVKRGIARQRILLQAMGTPPTPQDKPYNKSVMITLHAH